MTYVPANPFGQEITPRPVHRPFVATFRSDPLLNQQGRCRPSDPIQAQLSIGRQISVRCERLGVSPLRHAIIPDDNSFITTGGRKECL